MIREWGKGGEVEGWRVLDEGGRNCGAEETGRVLVMVL